IRGQRPISKKPRSTKFALCPRIRDATVLWHVSVMPSHGRAVPSSMQAVSWWESWAASRMSGLTWCVPVEPSPAVSGALARATAALASASALFREFSGPQVHASGVFTQKTKSAERGIPMNDRETRRYDVFNRVVNFCNNHQADFSPDGDAMKHLATLNQ